MPSPKEVYLNCDVLDSIPKENKDNWLFELKFLSEQLSKEANVLQVGSMDGTRILELLKLRPDLKLTGLEIDEPIHNVAVKKLGDNAKSILGDVLNPPELQNFDYVICLNNTLGYIEDWKKAVDNMGRLGNKIIVSVYGEKFHDELAKNYFKSINLDLKEVKEGIFIFEDFTKVKRFKRNEVEQVGKIIESPLGYICLR